MDWLLDDSHDLSNPLRQASLAEQFADAAFVAEEHPEGLPELTVRTDNVACAWVLDQLQSLAESGRGALRENPAPSLHWSLPLPQEKKMLDTGIWFDTLYASCSFMGARCKQQRLRHEMQAATPPVQHHGDC